jgi:ABC-type dipeptide/oligopeptide/nickel transport system permease subunit
MVEPEERRQRRDDLIALGLGALGFLALLLQATGDAPASSPLPAPSASLGTALQSWLWASFYALPMVASLLLLSVTVGVALAALSVYGPSLCEAVLRRAQELGGALPSLLILMLWRVGSDTPSILVFVLLLGALNGIELARLLSDSGRRMQISALTLDAERRDRADFRGFLRRARQQIHAQVAVQTALVTASMFGLDAALSFLDLGFHSVPTWGGLVGTAARTHAVAPVAVVLATLSMAATVLLIYRGLDRGFASTEG